MGDSMRDHRMRAPPSEAPAGTEAAVTTTCLPLSQESQDAMNGDHLHHKLVISNPDGLHLRPISAFAELAKRFQSQVTVHKDGKAFDGKSPLDLMLLGAAQGTELDLEVTGPDAPDALHGLLELLVSLAVVENSEPPPNG
jgi:phosphotransferase system HPr (HPr) family protein